MSATPHDLEKGIQAAFDSPDFDTFVLDESLTPSIKLLTEEEKEKEQEEEQEEEIHLIQDLCNSDWRVKLHIAFLIGILLLLLAIIIWIGITHA